MIKNRFIISLLLIPIFSGCSKETPPSTDATERAPDELRSQHVSRLASLPQPPKKEAPDPKDSHNEPSARAVAFAEKGPLPRAQDSQNSVNESSEQLVTFVRSRGLLPTPNDWSFNDTWVSRPVGDKDFYFSNSQFDNAVLGPDGPRIVGLKSNGLFHRMAMRKMGGHRMALFDPKRYKTLSPGEKKAVDKIMSHQWPFLSSLSITGREKPSQAAIDALGDRWLGAGMGEDPICRFEPLINFMREGKIGEFSSAQKVMTAPWTIYMTQVLIPALKKSHPQIFDAQGKYKKRYPWNHQEAEMLSKIYADTFLEFQESSRTAAAIAFAMPYHIARKPSTVSVNTTHYTNAARTSYARGVARSGGGHKFMANDFSAEETDRWTGLQADRSSFIPWIEEQGYPLNHIKIQMWRPFLTGANRFAAHCVLVSDIDKSGTYELNPVGEFAEEMLDFSEVLLDRGTHYSSVGILLDGSRRIPHHKLPTSSYLGLGVRHTQVDFMAAELWRTIFPAEKYSRYYNKPTLAAPYGEIFDLLSVNPAGEKVNPAVLSNYKILMDMGYLNVNQQFAEVLMKQVKEGGNLVLNVENLGEHLPPSFFGVSLTGVVAKADHLKCDVDGTTFAEETFSYKTMELQGAEVLYSTDGNPLITRFKVGKGHAILVSIPYMTAHEIGKYYVGLKDIHARPLLKFVPDFLDRLTAGSMPVELRCAPEDRNSLGWWVHRAKDGWLVFVMSYNPEMEYVFKGGAVTNVVDAHEYKALPFDLVCNVPIKDGLEIFGMRQVRIRDENGHFVASDFARYGDVRVYKLSEKEIVHTRTRHVNYAQGRPVAASSWLKRPVLTSPWSAPDSDRFHPHNAVDGNTDNMIYWQSGRWPEGDAHWGKENYQAGLKYKYMSYNMPSWLKVDLEQERSIDHMKVLFHHGPVADTPDMQPRIIRYKVELSLDGISWKTVVDESDNNRRLRPRTTTKWFQPTMARQAKITVTENTSGWAAQIVEFGVYGKDTETWTPPRVSPLGPAQGFLPNRVQNWPPNKLKYLMDLKSSGTKAVFLPRAIINTYYNMGQGGGGQTYQKILRFTQPQEIVYSIPEGAVEFAAVYGFGQMLGEKPGVILKVLVDGKESFNTGRYWGHRALPISIPVENGKELKVVYEVLKDGRGFPHTFLSEGRFLIK